MNSSFEKRKQDHIKLSLKDSSQASLPTGMNTIELIHEALPEINLDDISISTQLLGKKIQTPFFVSPMTAGWKDSANFNKSLAKICSKRSWVMCVGSQRAQLEDPEKDKEWESIRQDYPDLVVLGNLGLSQVISTPIDKIEHLVQSLKAQALQVHLNSLQEALQQEGTPCFKGGIQALERLVKELSVPVIVKETGCGFSEKTLDALTNKGLYAVDVSGLGGTHWGLIEGLRLSKEDFRFGIGETFSSWGVKTLESLLYASKKTRDFKLWSSGGMKNGLDAAKCLAIGAEMVGFGQSILKALVEGEDKLDGLMAKIEYELKVSLFCTGSSCLEELKGKWKKTF